MDKYDLYRYMLPYWQGDLVFNEQVLMVEDENGVAAAPLLYKLLKILSVRDASMNIAYKEGVDWELKDGKLTIIDGGSITPMKYNEFYPGSYNASASAHRYIDGLLTDQFIRVGSGAYFQPKLLNVTYTHGDKWDGPVPQYKGTMLPITMAKLETRQKTNIVVYGDSISHGDEATGFYLTNVPPYMPLWSDMAASVLKQKYGENISVTNLSVGGWTSSNGINGGYECYLQENVAGAKERVGSLRPDLVVIGFGHNDGDLAPNLLRANIRKIMDDIRSVSPDTEFIILGVMYPNPEVSAGDVPSYRYYKRQAEYDAALSSLEQNGAAFMPIKVYEDYFYAHKRPQDLHANNINHPNDFLYRFYAQYFCQTLIADFSSGK